MREQDSLLGLTWISLNLVVHAAMFVVGRLYGTCKVFDALAVISAWLVAPIFVPGYHLYRQYRRWHRAFRMARMILKSLKVDMTKLPLEEQRAFIERLRSDEDRRQIMVDALKRIREQQEGQADG